MSRASRMHKALRRQEVRTLTGKDAMAFCNQNTKQAIDKLAANGMHLSPVVTEPCGMIALVAFPDGTMKFQAECLPDGHEHDFAIEMLQAAIRQLEEQKAAEKLKENSGLLIARNAVPTNL